MAEWNARGPAGIGQGPRHGFRPLQEPAAYAAVVVGGDGRRGGQACDRVWCVADAGLVVNPDGAINQLEGGIIQSASWS